MSDLPRSRLFGKLNPRAFHALEAAHAFTRLRGNPQVEPVHWLHTLLQDDLGDLPRIARAAGLDIGALQGEMIAALERLPRGATAVRDFASSIEAAIERGWIEASVRWSATRIRSAHVLLAMLRTPELRTALFSAAHSFSRLSADDLAGALTTWTAGSEEAAADPDLASKETAITPSSASDGDTAHALDRFTVDLTARAREGRLDVVVGRDTEIRKVIDVLMRRRQNNPLLVGEAGVGKSAVVEGLALRVAAGQVPPALRGVAIRTLDVALLQAGAGVKGEFEQRLRAVIEAVRASATPVILFVDEAHTLVGAGGAAGTGDAANLLKPALARGELRTIGATTFAEYRRHIEKDPALTRRFQAITVAEPDAPTAVAMLRALANTLRSHHNVEVLDEALQAAVSLSQRCLPDRQLPDKAIALLDTACARVALSQHAEPPKLEASRERLRALQVERAQTAQELLTQASQAPKMASLDAELAQASDEVKTLSEQWQAEQAATSRVLRLREQLRNVNPKPAKSGTGTTDISVGDEPAATADLPALLEQEERTLSALQGTAPMVHAAVDRAAVAAVITDWTGIPVDHASDDEIGAVLELPARLAKRVVGQEAALAAVGRRLATSRAGLDDPQRPVGVFLLAGPSGVGKTETALALAQTLHGSESHLVTVNLSEYQEAHTVSALKGAPPGYVGHGEGGVLTEAVRRRPHGVVLLDELEKAHRDVHELFFQVFDRGTLEDGDGRRIDFRHSLILLTTNVGGDAIAAACERAATRGEPPPDADVLLAAAMPELKRAFPAALLGRMVTVPYRALTPTDLAQVVRLQLARIEERLHTRWGVPCSMGEDVINGVVACCTQADAGARAVGRLLTQMLLPQLSRELLLRQVERRPVTAVHIGLDDEGGFRIDLGGGDATVPSPVELEQVGEEVT